MSGSKVNSYGSTNTSLTNIQTVLDGTRMGFNAISLTNYSTTSVPAIAAGSQVEIAGSLYKFSTEEPISTTSATSTNFYNWAIELVPSSSTVTARISTSSPIKRIDYNGFYASTSSVNRFLTYYGESIFLSHVRVTGSSWISTNTQIWPFNSKIFDINNEFDVASYTFTAQKPGFYNVFFKGEFTDVASGENKFIVFKNGSSFFQFYYSTNNTRHQIKLCETIFLSSGEYINIRSSHTYINANMQGGENNMVLCIDQIK